MLNDKFKSYLHLHLLVFIAGFTGILGELITLDAVTLVWFRMLIALVFIFIYLKYKRTKLKINKASLIKFSLAGIIIALHWITFFESIKQSNISIALAMFSTGAFFTALIEPFFYKRRIIAYEVFFGALIVSGVFLITNAEIQYIKGITYGIASAIFSAFFSVLNGTFVKKHKASVISFYEFISGVLFISLFILLFKQNFQDSYFNMLIPDWIYLLILSSICTAYAFIAATHVMKQLSPFTVVLTYNLEPIYGIALAILLFPEKESMSAEFYIGVLLILITVIFNGILKNLNKLKRKPS